MPKKNISAKAKTPKKANPKKTRSNPIRKLSRKEKPKQKSKKPTFPMTPSPAKNPASPIKGKFPMAAKPKSNIKKPITKVKTEKSPKILSKP